MRKRVQYEVWLPVKVDLSQPPGHPGDCFFIAIGGYHQGTMEKINGKWVAHLSPKAWESLTIEDVRAMGDIIDEQYPED